MLRFLLLTSTPAFGPGGCGLPEGMVFDTRHEDQNAS
jgi:hypothetical protein